MEAILMDLKEINYKIDYSEKLLNNIAELSSKIMKDEKIEFKELDEEYKKLKRSLKEIRKISINLKKKKYNQ